MVKLTSRLTHQQIIEINRLLSTDHQSGVKITPLGGQSMIGGANSWLFTAPSGKQLLVDCGQQIVEFNAEKPPDWALPNFSHIDFDQLLGAALSHGHLDHILGIPALLTKKIFQEPPLRVFGKKTQRDLLERVFFKGKKGDLWQEQVQFNIVDGSQGIGEFHIDFYPVFHSIPDSSCLVITVAGKRICYLTDFKYMRNNWTEWSATQRMFQEIGRQGVDVLLLDSSNIDYPGFTPSASIPALEFCQILKNPEYRNKRIVVATFASDVESISDWATLANQIGRRPVWVRGSTMEFFFDNFGIAPDFIQNQYHLPPVVFVTGSQGEKFSALNRASRKENPYFELEPDDVIICASHIIDSNRGIFLDMKQRLIQMTHKVITADDHSILHVSGHENHEGLLQAVRDIAARVVVPCHACHANRQKLAQRIDNDDEINQMSSSHLLENSQTMTI